MQQTLIERLREKRLYSTFACTVGTKIKITALFLAKRVINCYLLLCKVIGLFCEQNAVSEEPLNILTH